MHRGVGPSTQETVVYRITRAPPFIAAPQYVGATERGNADRALSGIIVQILVS